MFKLPLVITTVSLLINTLAFSDEPAIKPATNFTGHSASCTTREDLDMEVYQLANFQLKMKQGFAQSVDTAVASVTFDARFFVCAKDPNSKLGYSFQREEDAIHDIFMKPRKHAYVIENYFVDKKFSKILDSNGFDPGFRNDQVAAHDIVGDFTQQNLDVSLKKLLNKKEREMLKAQSRLSKMLAVYVSYNGFNVNSPGGYRLDFDLEVAADGSVQIAQQKALQLK